MPKAGLSSASRSAIVWVGPPLSASPATNSRSAGAPEHPARLVRIDGDAGAAVDGDVGVDRQLAAAEDDGLPLHRGRELDPVGGQVVGIRERQRLAQGEHAVVGRDVARGRDDEGRADGRRARGWTGPARRHRCRDWCPPAAAAPRRAGRSPGPWPDRRGRAPGYRPHRARQWSGSARHCRRARPRTAGSPARSRDRSGHCRRRRCRRC